MKRGLVFLLATFISVFSHAQSHELKSTPEIYHDLQELHKGIRVLYLAAHPDDENTRLISWLENDQHVETAYLSLTRGQGGQNLIGDEKGDGLGVIRTYELLEARKVDGGEQFFTRAVDFGYSKSADESFEFWGKDEILKDVVYVIRMYRPHVIITRFPPTRRAGHGHHEASAILAAEAFELAGDETKFPDQIAKLGTWQPQALYHNTSSWWDKSLDDKTTEELKEQNMLKVDIGVFNDISGLGINEIASLARSKHRCQAFGTTRKRGQQWEYLELLKGEWTDEFLANIEGVWSRSPKHQEGIGKVVDEFDFINRGKNLELLNTNVEMLFAQRSMWAEGRDLRSIQKKYERIKRDLLGLRVEAYVGKEPIIIDDEYEVEVELYNAGSRELKVKLIDSLPLSDIVLKPGDRQEFKYSKRAPRYPSNPYWLINDHGYLYQLKDEDYLGLPKVDEYELSVQYRAEGILGGRFETAIHRKWNDRSVGEIHQPIQFVPPVDIAPEIKSLIAVSDKPVILNVQLKANKELDYVDFKASCTDENWEVSYEYTPDGLLAGQVRNVMLTIIPHKGAKPCELLFESETARGITNQMSTEIEYEHIPNVVLHDKAVTKLIPLDFKKNDDTTILYIEGSGDEVDESLLNIGYQVDKAVLSELSLEKLKSYKTVILGIRAFNKNESLPSYINMLWSYVEGGGNMIVQYNTTYDLKVDQIAPYPLVLSRNRVTDERSTVKLLDEKHPIFRSPNAITDQDFESWVQERGLYFAGSWDEQKFTPLISWADKGEEPQLGGLLVAEYGKGQFIYTGISFFRQLPAGVPGAYKLMINMIEFEQ